MTGTSARPPKDYGPIQLGTRLDLRRWQLERAMEVGLLARPDAGGRWAAAAVDDAAARRDEIAAAVGTLPDMGAGRAADVLSDRFGVTVLPGAVLELAARGLLPRSGKYKNHDLYCGRALEAFDDRAALDAAAWDGRLLMTDQVVEFLRVRRSDVDHLVRAGWLRPTAWAHSLRQRRRAAPEVALYRGADLDALLEDPAIDWDAVRATPRGRPSILAGLEPRENPAP